MTAAHMFKDDAILEVIKKYNLENDFPFGFYSLDDFAQMLAITNIMNKVYKSKLSEKHLDECVVEIKKEVNVFLENLKEKNFNG